MSIQSLASANPSQDVGAQTISSRAVVLHRAGQLVVRRLTICCSSDGQSPVLLVSMKYREMERLRGVQRSRQFEDRTLRSIRLAP